MKSEPSFLERILVKFSYTTKVKFILSCGYVLPFLLLVMNYIIILGTLKSLEMQMSGVEYLAKCSNAFEQIANYIRLDPSISENQRGNLESEVDENTHQIILKGHQWIESLTKNKEFLVLDQLGYKMDLFADFWEQIKKDRVGIQSGKNSSAIEGFCSAYLQLLNQISIVTDLQFNLDGETGFLIHSIVSDMPVTQTDILISLHKALPLRPEIQTEAALALFTKDLESNVLQLFTDVNAVLKLKPDMLQTEGLSKLLIDYKQGVMKFTDIIKVTGSDEMPDRKGLLELGNKLLDSSFRLNHDLQEELRKIITVQTQRIRAMIWGCMIILLLGGSLVLVIYLSRVMRHPLDNLTNAAQDLSKGNLAVRVPITTRDEVAKVSMAFNEMAGYYESVLKKATAIIDRLFTTSSTISTYARGFETNVNAEERTVKQISANARNIKRTVEDFSDTLQKAYQEAIFTSAMAEKGRTNLHEMEAIMQDMLSSSSNVVTTLSALREKFVNINQVIFTIVKIADQSNLLSLNTVIRATRSGTEGRGFVVIADKIREMAEQIAFATLDIEKVIKEIVGAVQDTVQHVDNFSGQIRKQVEETTDISNQLKELIGTTQEQIRDFEKIHEEMKSQNQGILEIDKSIEELKVRSQELAFSVRKLYLEIEYLHESSQHLQDKTKMFTFTQAKVEGGMRNAEGGK